MFKIVLPGQGSSVKLEKEHRIGERLNHKFPKENEMLNCWILEHMKTTNILELDLKINFTGTSFF